MAYFQVSKVQLVFEEYGVYNRKQYVYLRFYRSLSPYVFNISFH